MNQLKFIRSSGVTVADMSTLNCKKKKERKRNKTETEQKQK
jgi:hypothetical protein